MSMLLRTTLPQRDLSQSVKRLGRSNSSGNFPAPPVSFPLRLQSQPGAPRSFSPVRTSITPLRSSTPVNHTLPIPVLVVPAPPSCVPPMVRSPKPTAREVIVAQPFQPFLQYNPQGPMVADLQNQLVGLQMSLAAESQARENNGVNITVTLNELAALTQAATRHENLMQKMQDELMISGRERRSMQAQIDELKSSLQTAHDRIEYLENDVEAMKGHLSEFDWFSQNEMQRNLHRIEERGNVQVNFDTGDIHLIRPISFAPRTTRDKPTAEFTRPEIAAAICGDLAEVMNLFACPVTVEGHTKGGEGEFWQTLADERARVVVDRMVASGADPALITTAGLPGTLGQNETVTKVRLHLPEEARQALQRRGSLTDGRASVDLTNGAS